LQVVANGRAQLQIEISDDGMGLPTDLHLGVGLASMRERAEELGGLLVVTNLAQGTRFIAQLPLETTTH
jgi:signal transduction histidine kinase